jgi:hypothetical protein
MDLLRCMHSRLAMRPGLFNAQLKGISVSTYCTFCALKMRLLISSDNIDHTFHDLEDFYDGEQWDDDQQLEHDGIQPIIDEPAPQENRRAIPSDTVYTTVEVPGFPRDDPPDHPEDDRTMVPPAYRDNEPSWVCIVYLQAVLNNVAGNMSVKQTTQNLNSTLNALNAAGVLPDRPRPVRTLASAKKRLGIDPDVWITQYAMCPCCWKHYSPKQVIKMESPQCHSPACNGMVYTVTTDDKGRLKRRAIKIIPHISLIDSLCRIARCKGFRKLVRDSRQTPAMPNDDEEFVMMDMHDAAIWHDLKTGIKREVGNYGHVRDLPVGLDTERKLTDFRFGLHLVVNLDWYIESAGVSILVSLPLRRFGAFENRAHSAGPVYVTINDFPRDRRFLQVNTVCPLITPGPLEPTTEQLNHCLELPVSEICRLKNGEPGFLAVQIVNNLGLRHQNGDL